MGAGNPQTQCFRCLQYGHIAPHCTAAQPASLPGQGQVQAPVQGQGQPQQSFGVNAVSYAAAAQAPAPFVQQMAPQMMPQAQGYNAQWDFPK